MLNKLFFKEIIHQRRLLILPLLFSVASAYSQTSNQNYVRTRVPRREMTTQAKLDGLTSNKDSVESSIQYVDGLGRPLQSVEIRATPGGKDLVEPVAYDGYGREAVKYLPYAVTGGNGAFQADPFAAQSTFYNPAGTAASVTQLPGGIARNNSPYSQTIFEASPLNRVIEQGAAGTPWQPYSATSHTVKTVYCFNNDTTFTSDSVRSRRAVLYTATIDANQSRKLVNSGFYTAGDLYVTVIRDENWRSGRAGTTEEYKDKEGRVVLKRNYQKPVGGILEVWSTYYIYDDFGNLAYVLPPGATPDAAGPMPQLTLDNFAYQYRYDERGRLTQKKIPGKGWEFTVYNKLDQVVGTQDSVQRLKVPQEWRVTKYDGQGRMVQTGIWQHTGTTSGANNLSVVQGLVNGIAVMWESRPAASNYTNAAWPKSGISVTLQQNYYDGYDIPGIPYTGSGFTIRTAGLLTATKTNVLGTGDMLWTVNWYDELGRLGRTVNQHYLGGATQLSTYNYDEIIYARNFRDDLVQTVRTHMVSNSAKTAATTALTVTEVNYYDHKSRLRYVSHQVRNGTDAAQQVVWMSAPNYNEIGQLTQKKLHGLTYNGNYLQTVDYRYNERGWLSSINNSDLNSDGGSTNNDTKDVFGMNLYYITTDTSQPQYNGNIATISWKQAPLGGVTPAKQVYDYRYDRLNRLTDAVSTSTVAKDGFYNEHLRYDQMGNITKLGRYERNGSGTRVQIDSLTYTYTGNKMTRVDDAAAVYTGSGFQDGTQQVNEYTYDGNGNMTKDLNKGVTAISYNLLNLPQTVTTASGNISYVYDATGQKLRKISGSTTTEYISGIQYNGSVIDFLQTSEGRARKSGTVYKYEYDLKDHLGDTRTTVTWNASDATQMTPQVLQENDYYAFGLSIKSREPVVPSPKNQYLYNGKELQEEVGLYDYGARFYDPVIGRWTGIDPKAEVDRRWSTYNYTSDDPINRFDPDGNKDKPFNKKTDKPITKRQGTATLVKPMIAGMFKNSENCYNCHSFAWHDSKGDPKNNPELVKQGVPKWDDHPEKDVSAKGVRQLGANENNKQGDRVIYFIDINNDGKYESGEIIEHSAIVTKVDKKGNTTEVAGKMGQLEISDNHPDAPGYYKTDGNGNKTTRAYFRIEPQKKEEKSEKKNSQ